MNAERDNPIPDWAARERQADMAWIHDNLGIFWPRAEELFRSHGRGAFVADTTLWMPEGGHPLCYLPQRVFEEDGAGDVLRLVREYRSAGEFVTVLLKGSGRESSYRVRIRRREAADINRPNTLDRLLLETLEQNDGLCLDEEAERQVLAAILSSVITDLLGEELAPGVHSRPLNGKPDSPAVTP